jgi:hypothetical protein
MQTYFIRKWKEGEKGKKKRGHNEMKKGGGGTPKMEGATTAHTRSPARITQAPPRPPGPP